MPQGSDSGAAVESLEATVGHPGRLWEALQARVQDEAITQFRQVGDDWLALMWCIDAYRIAGLPPSGMGKASISDAKRLDAVYRTKGNWFSTLLALLLQNQTSQVIRPRTKVQGFSQLHQIDLAWPSRTEDPLVCVETKVTGAPPFGSTPTRGAMSDWTNRRKELKFAATDLKLYRRQQNTSINHWGVWREKAPPKTYFIWAARLRIDGTSPDDVKKLLAEAQALVNTYLEGAGLFAWRTRSDGSGYETVALPANAHVTDIDDVLHRVASEISELIGPKGQIPAIERPKVRAVNPKEFSADL